LRTGRKEIIGRCICTGESKKNLCTWEKYSSFSILVSPENTDDGPRRDFQGLPTIKRKGLWTLN